MVGQIKKKLVVVKNLRDLSPKRQLLVSSKPAADSTESEGIVPSNLGNHSPHVSIFFPFAYFILFKMSCVSI